MSYPQPSPDKTVLGGQQVFRLRTTLVSPGDTYDSQQSGYGFAIGPDSDIANVDVNYFDAALPSRMNQVTIGAGAPFVGLLEARNEPATLYMPQKVSGRIIFSPGDVVPQLPATDLSNGLMRIPPVMDIVQYLSPPTAGIAAPRNDRTYFLFIEGDNAFAASSIAVEVPCYGRTFGQAIVAGSGSPLATQIDGLIYAPGVDGGSPEFVVPIQASVSIANTQIVKLWNKDTAGMFDYIRITLTHTNSTGNLYGIFLHFRD